MSLDFIFCTKFELYKALDLTKFELHSAPGSWEIIFLVVGRLLRYPKLAAYPQKYIGGSIRTTMMSLNFILCTKFDLYKGLNQTKFEPWSPPPQSWEINFLVFYAPTLQPGFPDLKTKIHRREYSIPSKLRIGFLGSAPIRRLPDGFWMGGPTPFPTSSTPDFERSLRADFKNTIRF